MHQVCLQLRRVAFRDSRPQICQVCIPGETIQESCICRSEKAGPRSLDANEMTFKQWVSVPGQKTCWEPLARLFRLAAIT